MVPELEVERPGRGYADPTQPRTPGRPLPRPKKLLDIALHLVQDGRGGGVLNRQSPRDSPPDGPRQIQHHSAPKVALNAKLRAGEELAGPPGPAGPAGKRRGLCRAPSSVSSTRPASMRIWTDRDLSDSADKPVSAASSCGTRRLSADRPEHQALVNAAQGRLRGQLQLVGLREGRPSVTFWCTEGSEQPWHSGSSVATSPPRPP